MSLIKKREMALTAMADLENAVAGAQCNTADMSDVMTALVELGDMMAAQDDAIVELAGLIEEGGM